MFVFVYRSNETVALRPKSNDDCSPSLPGDLVEGEIQPLQCLPNINGASQGNMCAASINRVVRIVLPEAT